LSATAYPSGVKGTPVEINEAVAPLLFLKKEYNPGSGGKGKYNGGMGQVIEIKSAINEDMDLLASFDRIKFPARGRMNGENGKAGHVSIKNKGKLNGKGTQVIKAGDIIEIFTPGGAGLGDYSERNEDLIKIDKENELL
jgi:N-methylhydantoinase B